MKPPSESVAAPLFVPSTITLAPANACPSDELMVPLILPVVFATMHFAYGFGYLLGLCYFIFKWSDKEIKDSYFDKTTFINN